ncbi:MAG: response regulator [Desulfobacterales bacterium]|nr:response regulator [Desulfobacterales bacterium]MBF0397411.1 response regulator [Desulfobacterales bacterium]
MQTQSKNKKRKILVVDDSPTLRTVIKEELEHGGYEVIEAEDGIIGLSKAANSKPDLITLDIEMPRINGFETCRRLHSDLFSNFFSRGKDYRVPIIFISGNDTIKDRIKGFELGVSNFVTKPFNRGSLLLEVNKILKPSDQFSFVNALLVDQNPCSRRIILESLKVLGVNVVCEENVNISKIDKSIDLVISDFILPEFIEFCTKVKEEKPYINLICLISNSEKSIDAFKIGASDYLIKPFIKEVLINRLTYQLEKIKKTKNKDTSRQFSIDRSFLTNMSHEIRTPLNAILGITQIALNTELPEKLQNYFHTIKTSAYNLFEIANDILEFSQIEAGLLSIENQDFSLQEIIESLADRFAKQSEEKGIGLSLSIDKEIPIYLLGDGVRLNQILNRLLSNSIKFTEHGSIDLNIHLEEKYGDVVKLKFCVKDTGIGVKKEYIKEVFNPFMQADTSITRKYGGAGLGLTICRHLIKLMKGEIQLNSPVEFCNTEIESECPGCVVEFIVEFKISKNKELESSNFEIKTNFIGKKILLVEDNSINQQVAIEMLSSGDIKVKVANNGKEAVSAMKEDKFDAILMDIQMPEMDGIEASRIIREDFKTIPIIAVTACAMHGDREKCIEAGMNDYLTKPIDRIKLFQALTKWIKPSSSDENNLKQVKPDSIKQLYQSANKKIEKNLPQDLPGIDINSALKRLGGNQNLLRKLFKDFYNEHFNVFNKICESVSNGDTELSRRLAHTIKGIAGVFSARELQSASYELETGIKDNKPLGHLLPRFKLSLNQVLESIKSIEQIEEDIQTSENIDIPTVTPILSKLAFLLKENDLLAEDCLKNAKQHLGGQQTKEHIKNIEEHISNLDFDKAYSSLMEMIKVLEISL